MSRIGKKEIEIPQGVEIKLQDGKILVKGPRGTLTQELDHPELKFDIKEGKLNISRLSEDKKAKSLHGLARALVFNMVKGVSAGFTKDLEISGVGYKATKQGNKLVLQIGYSHPVEVNPPQGIEIVVEGVNKIKVIGSDKQVVGSVAAEIKEIRPVEPYKGKGIKYAGEFVRRKAGKVAKVAGSGA